MVEKMLASIFGLIFLIISRYITIFGIYYFLKHEIKFYDILIIIGFTSLWAIEGSLNSIYNKINETKERK